MQKDDLRNNVMNTLLIKNKIEVARNLFIFHFISIEILLTS